MKKNVSMEVTQAFPPVLEPYTAEGFPRLATGDELREHTRTSFFQPPPPELCRLGELLDEYRLAADRFRKLSTVHAHGMTQLSDLYKDYREQLKRERFQRRYCAEMARWEPGCNLERKALACLQNQAFMSPEQLRIVRDAVMTVYHHHELSLELAPALPQPRWLPSEATALQMLELAEEYPAGREAIASLRRAELLLSENAAAGEWLAQAREAGRPLPTLAQMQEQLEQTELWISQMHDRYQKMRRHLARYSDHVRDARTAAAAGLLEVCRFFHTLRDRHLQHLIERNKDGFLAKLQRSIRRAEEMFDRGRAGASSL